MGRRTTVFDAVATVAAVATVGVLALGTLSGPAQAGGGTAAWTSADYQRAELLACKDALGLTGSARLVTQRAADGTARVRMAPHDRIDAEEAAAVNACADRRRSGAAAAAYRQWPSAASCYGNGPLLYRGNLYCFYGR